MDTCLKCPITALKVTGDILLSGQGSKLVLYHLSDNSKLLTVKLFNSSRIHKFVECQSVPGVWLVIGGKHARCIKLEKCGESYQVSTLCDEKVFKAWLWDAYWITEESLLLISSHNTVLYWNPFNQHTSVVSSCVQQCILYSATFSLYQDEVIVAVGTVFNKVLLWKPEHVGNADHEYKDVYKAFVGHEGVIFRIRFHPSEAQLLSVSDDRSIRLWSIADETCLQVLYGHTARVWDALYSNEYIVSIGEDAMCILWSLEGNVVKKYGGHKGKSIWSMDVHDDVIITGGGDCAIRVWNIKSEQLKMIGGPLELILPTNTTLINEKASGDYPRIVRHLDHTNVIVLSNTGVLWNYHIPSDTWTVVHQDERFSSYCCLDMASQMIAIGNLTGLVTIFDIRNPLIVCEEQIFDGKIFSLFWLKLESRCYILVCGPGGEIKVLEVKSDQNLISLTERYQFTCPPSKQCWIAAVDIIGSNHNVSDMPDEDPVDVVLICGDRRGSVHVFLPKAKDPHQSILGVHGKTGVTRIMARGDYIFSTGRDGAFRKYRYDFQEQQLHLIDKQKACKGMDWIEGIWFKNDSDTVIYGFYMQSHFAAWNYETNEILFKIKCGGGYRSWDVVFPNTNGETSLCFSYVKGVQLNVVCYDWLQMYKDKIIEDGVHGREVMAVKVLGKHVLEDTVIWLLVTCSEDTTINFQLYDETKNSIQSLHTAVGHIGGVKDVCFVPSKPRGKEQINGAEPSFHGYFISSGSRTSLKFWKITDNVVDYIDDKLKSRHRQTSSSNHAFSCSLISEIFNPETKLKKMKLKDRTLIDDMRYLSCDSFLISEIYPDLCNHGDLLCCVCACSDGVVRMYTINDSVIKLLTSMNCDQHCVLTVQIHTCYINDSNRIFLIATATNGLIYIWDITSLIKNHVDSLMNFVTRDENESVKLNDQQSDGLFNSDYELEDVSHVENEVGLDSGISEERSSYEHINKNRYKFHDLNTPLWDFDGPCITVSTHQSGVNTLDICQVDGGFILASGGDDSCICITKLILDGNNLKVKNRIQYLSAHISSVSAIVYLSESIVVSTSVDQRIKFWSIKDDNILLMHEMKTDVADVSNMECWISTDNVYVAVCGVGLEIFSLSMQQITDGTVV